MVLSPPPCAAADSGRLASIFNLTGRLAPQYSRYSHLDQAPYESCGVSWFFSAATIFGLAANFGVSPPLGWFSPVLLRKTTGKNARREARHEIWGDGYTSKGVAMRHKASFFCLTSPSNLPSHHSAPTPGPIRPPPPRPRCHIRSALRLRPSAEAPHGRATTTLRLSFMPVGAIAVGGCGSRTEPSIRARAGGRNAEKYIERRLNAVSVIGDVGLRLESEWRSMYSQRRPSPPR